MRTVAWTIGLSLETSPTLMGGWEPSQHEDALDCGAIMSGHRLDCISGVRLPADPSSIPWFLILGIGGLLFIVVTSLLIFWLLRRPRRFSEDEPAREGEQSRSGEGEAASGSLLEEGATLNAGRFVVLRVREQHEGLTTYEIRDLEVDRYCQVCGASRLNPDANRCLKCNAAIQVEHPARLIAKETRDPDVFALGQSLHTLNIHHPAVILPIAVFSELYHEETRYYHVMPDVEFRSSVDTDPPHSPDRVMGWGIALADGLAALHRQGIAFREVNPESILIDDEEAYWSCCGPLMLIKGETEEDFDRAFGSDVRGLGRWLLLKATGKMSLGPELPLPDPLAKLLSRVLTATYPMSAQQLVEQLDQIRRQLVTRKDVSLWAGARTDTGRIRELNEDSMWVADYSDAFATLTISVGAFAVADGVGGHAAGDVASQLTVDVLQQYGDELRRAGEMKDLPDPRAWLAQAAEAANARVLEERQAVSSDMGATLVMALVAGNDYTVLNVGDSRAYRLGLQGIQQVTIDHTLVQRLVSIGQLTRDQAKMHPRRNVIYRVMGGRSDLEYDIFNGTLSVGEALLLCSDGLTDMLSDPVLWQIWRETSSPQEACNQMVDEANRVGGHDNITVIVVQVITKQNKDAPC